MISFRLSVAAVVACVGASTALAQISTINGYQLQARNFNDFGNSSLAYNPPSANIPSPPSNIPVAGVMGPHRIVESIPAFSPGNFANRHLLQFSNDGGTTPYAFDQNESFRIDYCHRITTNMPTGPGSPAPVEGGLWIRSPRFNPDGSLSFTDEGGVFTGTNGTVFMGGAGLPFSLLGEGNGSPGAVPLYTAGGLANVSFIYEAPAGPGLPAYVRTIFEDVASGVTKDTGWINWLPGTNGGDFWTPGTEIGFRFAHTFSTRIIDANHDQLIDCVKIVPAPGAAGMLSLVGLVALRRRR